MPVLLTAKKQSRRDANKKSAPSAKWIRSLCFRMSNNEHDSLSISC